MCIKVLFMFLMSVGLFAQDSHSFDLQKHSKVEDQSIPHWQSLSSQERFVDRSKNSINRSLHPPVSHLSGDHQLKGRDFRGKSDPTNPHTRADNQLLDSIWVNTFKRTYSYDTNNNMTERLDSLWDGETSAWENWERMTCSYDINNNLTEELYAYWDSENNAWVNGHRVTSSYDGNNNLTENLHYEWDAWNSVWKNRGKMTCSYDSNGNMTEELYSNWDAGNSVWAIGAKFTYSYDGNNNLTERLQAEWDAENSIWVNGHKWTYSYDGNNNLTVELSFNWDYENSVWVSSMINTYVYDEDGQLIIATEPAGWGRTITIRYSYDEAGRLTEEIHGRFEQSPVDIQAVNANPEAFTLLQNYPNPFNPTTTISYDLPEQTTVRLIVFDIQGREVIRLQNAEKAGGNYEVQWNGMDKSGSPVSTGMYLCRLEAGGFSQTIKMVYLR